MQTGAGQANHQFGHTNTAIMKETPNGAKNFFGGGSIAFAPNLCNWLGPGCKGTSGSAGRDEKAESPGGRMEGRELDGVRSRATAHLDGNRDRPEQIGRSAPGHRRGSPA